MLKNIHGKSILINGATGFVGSHILKTLERFGNIKIIVQGRNKEKFRAMFPSEHIKFVQTGFLPQESLDYIIHLASPTASKEFLEKPVEVLNAIIDRTREMLELARKNNASMIYLSSMEIYGDNAPVPASEDDYGYIDILKPRSSYPEGKRAAECLCAAYAAEYGVDVKIVRLAQTIGANPNWKTDNRMLYQFARAVIENKPIEIVTNGLSKFPTIDIDDAISGILTILIRGKKGEAYNLAREGESLTVREMAEIVADKIANGAIKVIVKGEPPKEYFKVNLNLKLNINKIKQLGWKPMINTEESYRRMIKFAQNNTDGE
jgi:dTDP-glucose 4,6-dehydratase